MELRPWDVGLGGGGGGGGAFVVGLLICCGEIGSGCEIELEMAIVNREVWD